ncbi:lasso peptide biosynthesis PqqD family chaperone [Streptomyces sp. SudanB182_2057]|uniref:lasso peptide biosynthesis PqqD family chaperone n=1 Tax=Streptomyces sp. SudanB182_2057 TaxID=3035281 RepID=UPI003F54B5DD
MSVSLAAYVTAVDTDGGAMVLLDERTGKYRQLNPTGALVLRLLLRGATAEDAAAALAERYPQAVARAGEDVARLVEALRRAGLLRD